MWNKVIILFFLLFPFIGKSQTKKYFVYLTDKINSEFTISKPLDFLSQKSIDRRTKQNISITYNDLPVKKSYLDSLSNYGIVIYSSKWFNGALIEADSINYTKLLTKSFVKNGIYAGKIANPNPTPEKIPDYKVIYHDKSPLLEDYGTSLNQNLLIGADEMHDFGFDGSGITIGIFDIGFQNVDILPVFDSLNIKNKIKGTYDFVNNNEDVYDAGTHGTMVLSTIGGYSKGNLIGTAYNADYYLFATEDGGSEKRIEEFYWLFAAEKADSIGIDIINTSLGYTEFDDSTMNYTYEDMNGNTAIITKATDLAISKGMICVNSAGNSGNDSWYYIGAPADADSVLAVGAVDSLGFKAGFSSYGPSFDGRIKPNLCAQGQDITACLPDGNFVKSNGTSFASPILCGMVAGFWQAHPTLSNMKIVDYLQQSGTTYNSPDAYCGYGVPNFRIAHEKINAEGGILNKFNNEFNIYPNPIKLNNENLLHIKLSNSKNIISTIIIHNNLGQILYNKTHNTKNKANIIIDEIIHSKGIYFVKVITKEETHSTSFIVD